jgi:predicted DNA-binding protein
MYYIFMYICNMKEEILTTRINKETKEKLKALAAESKRTMSDYLILLIEEAIEQKKKL